MAAMGKMAHTTQQDFVNGLIKVGVVVTGVVLAIVYRAEIAKMF